MNTAPEPTSCRIPIAVTLVATLAGIGSVPTWPADACFGPWLDAENYSYCTAGRMEPDEKTGEPIPTPDPNAFYVRCRHGQAAGYELYVTGGSPKATARKRAAVCEAESPLRGVRYPPKLLNTLTR